LIYLFILGPVRNTTLGGLQWIWGHTQYRLEEEVLPLTSDVVPYYEVQARKKRHAELLCAICTVVLPHE